MTRVAFGELRGEEVLLTDADGNELKHPSALIEILFLSRLDCEIRCLAVPPVAEQELPALIRYRLRSVYPGSLENVAVDQIVQRRKGARVALVSLVQKETLERYRRVAPRAALSLLSVSLLRGPLSRTGSVIHWTSKYAEVMRFETGVLVESTLVKRSRPSSDVQRIMRLLANAPPGCPPVFLAARAELTSLQEHFSILSPRTETTESIDFVGRRVPPLFRPRKRFELPRPAPTRAALAVAVAVLAAGVFFKYVSSKEAELSALRSTVLGGQASSQQQAALEAQYNSLKSSVAGLIRNRPVDVFQFLADLRTELGPGSYIQDIVLQGSSFQFQAAGPSPLSSMRRFLEDSRFRDVRLLQTTPIPGTSRQQFIVTGKYAR